MKRVAIDKIIFAYYLWQVRVLVNFIIIGRSINQLANSYQGHFILWNFFYSKNLNAININIIYNRPTNKFILKDYLRKFYFKAK